MNAGSRRMVKRCNNNSQSKKQEYCFSVVAKKTVKISLLVENYLIIGKSTLSFYDIKNGYFKECLLQAAFIKWGPRREA